MLYPREIIPGIKKVLGRGEFIILSGPRQSGKTSLLILLKDFLDKKGEPCAYLNLENPEYLKLLNKHPFNIFELVPEKKSRQNIFIDEIQYLDDPTNFLKLLYDEKSDKLKIIASGSSAFYIDRKFKDSLAGRKFIFEIYPLSFEEFLIFNRQDDLLEQRRRKLSAYYRKRLLGLWERYLVYGGYPKVALGENDEIRKIILEEIGASYIKKDIAEAGIKSAEKYFSLMRILASRTGGLLNSQELAGTLGVVHKTIEEYLYVMSKSYHAAFIRPFFRNLRKELTRMPKVYFYDLGLRNFFLNSYQKIEGRLDKGAYLENIVFKECLRQAGSADKIKFWRTQDKKEVDFVVGEEAFEVKFSPAQARKGKYDMFQRLYPDIKLKFLTYDDILTKFYPWKF